ncbi:MAG: hypothetical protein MJ076_04785 [Clostridia bacterium]|nr:hypothetical protein [Clostridia bacterium]
MSNILLGYIFSYLYLFLLILVMSIIKKLFHINVEISRKILHLLIGFTWLILYRYLANTIHIVIVPLTFIIINYFSYKFKLFKVFEREDDNNNHLGTIFYAVSMTVLSIFSLIYSKSLIPYGIAVFCLSFGDGFAAIFGYSIKQKNIQITKEKTLVGSIACVIGAGIGILLFKAILSIDISFLSIIILSISTGVLELVGNGFDNFSITFGVTLLSLILI